jgi:hypothetical protein
MCSEAGFLLVDGPAVDVVHFLDAVKLKINIKNAYLVQPVVDLHHVNV